MPISQTALQGILASATSEVFLECLTFSHSTFSQDLRLVNNTQDITRQAGVFSRFSFDVIAAEKSSQRPPAIVITADMVDQRIMTAIRTLEGNRERAKITLEVVRAAEPDVIEYGPAEFDFDGADTDGMTKINVRASFLAGALNDAFPYLLFSPSNAT